MFFESIPRERRTSVLTIYNFGNSLAQVVGALLGAWWLREFGRSYDSYLWLFVASSVARAATIVMLNRVPQPGAPLVDPVDEPAASAAPRTVAGDSSSLASIANDAVRLSAADCPTVKATVDVKVTAS